MTDSASLSRLKRALADRYPIDRPLGTGGMATVYLARDLKHQRDVALKVLRPELAVVLGAERFLNEIRVTAALDHPHILTLLDSGETDGFLWYVLPYVRGESLRHRLNREGPLPLADALAITRQIAAALDYAHQKGVIHRDVKPENILLFEGEAMLADFGIALAVGPVATSLTQTGLSLGTPQYMSPEQATGAPLDPRSDVYSLAAVLYETLAGEPPHSASSAQAILTKLLTDRPTPLCALRSTVPEAVEAAVDKALAKLPADRFVSATQFVSALDAGQGSATARSWRDRRPAASASIAVMPFTNFSNDPATDYFGEGLAEELTGALARAGLLVIGRGSTRQLAAKGLDTRQVARDLEVATVLQGAWQRAEERVRISVSLISGADGSVIWNDRYDRRLQDIFAIQDDIARTVAGQLRATLTREASGRLVRQETTDPDAHALYLRGLYLWNRRTASSIRQAIAMFEQAIARDHNYGRAYAGIAMAKAVLPWYDDVNEIEIAVEAFDAVQHAIAIDSTLSAAWAARGLVIARQRKPSEAAADFARAIDLDPTFATARFWHGLHLVQAGRFEGADHEFARARELEPASLVIRVGSVILLTNQRRHAAAEALARELLKDDPTFALARWHLGTVLADAERFQESIETLSSMSDVHGVRPAEVQAALAYALVRAGRSTDAQRVTDGLCMSGAGGMPPSALLASALMVLGDHETALDVLNAAVRQHDPFLMLAARAARYDPLRSDSQAHRIFQLAERIDQ